jgi:cytochrome b involved in lipid metabolism
MAARVPTPHQSEMSNLKDATHLPAPYKLRRYYTPEEVAAHATHDDCWVSFFNGVYDLTKLLAKS